jgi:GGDEF domain-containing protein
MDGSAAGGTTDRDGLVAELAATLRRGDAAGLVAVRIRDIDGFLRIGAIGSLDATAERLGRLVRSADVLARIDDATFLLLAPGLTSATATGLVERVEGAVAFPVEVGDDVVSLTTDVRVSFPSAPAVGDRDAVGAAAAAVSRALSALDRLGS